MAIVVYGCGGHGKVLADAVQCAGEEVLGFVDDNPALKDHFVLDRPVLGGFEALKGHPRDSTRVLVAVGRNDLRRRMAARVLDAGFMVASVVHPSAVVAESAHLGAGVQVLAQAVVGPDCRVHDGAVLNTGALVDHDCVLGAYCQVYPGAHVAGTVTVGEESYVGTGASIIPGVRIGDRTTIGAGAVVVDDMPSDVTAVGVPARITQRMGEEEVE